MKGASERGKLVQQLSMPLYSLPAIDPRLLICLLYRGIARVGDVVPYSSKEIMKWLTNAGHRGRDIRQQREVVMALLRELRRLELPLGVPLEIPLAKAYQEKTKNDPMITRLLGKMYVKAPCPSCGALRVMSIGFYEEVMVKKVARSHCNCDHYYPSGNSASRVNRCAGADVLYAGNRD